MLLLVLNHILVFSLITLRNRNKVCHEKLKKYVGYIKSVTHARVLSPKTSAWERKNEARQRNKGRKPVRKRNMLRREDVTT